MTKIKRIQPYRRFVEAVQAAVIVGLPFLKIKGESALRFDIPSLQLHFFGASIWMEEFFIVLIAIIFLTFLIVSITLMFGRLWCGWLCPQTVIIDFTQFVDKAKSKGLLYRPGAYSTMLLISVVVAANLIWYFVPPYEFITGMVKGSLGNVTWGFWIVLSGILFLNFAFLRHTFCATVCPYAKLQSVLFDSKTLVISFDPRRKEECIKCMACVRTCPVGIDIREGLSAACMSCAKCIDECTEKMAHRQKKSIIGYFFGLPGETGRILRQNAIMLGLVTALFLIFFIYLILIRIIVDMTVLPNYSFPPRIAADGGVVNSYILSVKNRGRSDIELEIRAIRKEGSIKITPDRIQILAGSINKFPVYVHMENLHRNENIESIDISIRSKDAKEEVVKKANFIIPEG